MCLLTLLTVREKTTVPCPPRAAVLVCASSPSCLQRRLVLPIHWCMVELAYGLLIQLRKCRRTPISLETLLIRRRLKCSVPKCPWATPVFIVLRRRKSIPLFGLNWWAPGPLTLRTMVVKCNARLGVGIGLLGLALRVTVCLSITTARLKMLPRWRRLLTRNRRVGTLGKMTLVRLDLINVLRLVCGWLESSSPASLLCMCLVDMTLTWLCTEATVLVVLGVTWKFSRVMNCMVCTTCNGLLLKDRCGLIGACNMFPDRLSVLLNGLMNRRLGMCRVTVPMAKLWWDRLFLSALLQPILGPCELGLHALE